MIPQLFVDQDGVLADFNAHYAKHFGAPPLRLAEGDPVGMWDNIRSRPNFYRELPLLPDAKDLWDGLKHLNPVVLTGVPYDKFSGAELQKRAWMREHLDSDVPVICCWSADKYLHGKPGDILIDDWDRYKSLWDKMGGLFIQHLSAARSLNAVSILEKSGYFDDRWRP